MNKQSEHSQDYDRKHGTDHDVKDKAALTKEFVGDKRTDAKSSDDSQSARAPDEEK
jgi:hypothetical protein